MYQCECEWLLYVKGCHVHNCIVNLALFGTHCAGCTCPVLVMFTIARHMKTSLLCSYCHSLSKLIQTCMLYITGHCFFNGFQFGDGTMMMYIFHYTRQHEQAVQRCIPSVHDTRIPRSGEVSPGLRWQQIGWVEPTLRQHLKYQVSLDPM